MPPKVESPATDPDLGPGCGTAAPGIWTGDELLRWVGFCPQCRRVVWVNYESWRPAVPAAMLPDGRVVPGEPGNVLGLVRTLGGIATDVLPRDRPQVARWLGRDFTAFGFRLELRHNCASREARPHPDDGWKPARGREVYDVGG